jgi:ABC-2 type transport system permease protein
MRIKQNINSIIVIAYRDILKFLKDRPRIFASLIFPIVFIGILGGSSQAAFSSELGINFLTFTFTGVLAQTLFQSSASGIISLIEDRQNDFSQEIFVSPIYRYSILLGKILGESCVSLFQAIGIIGFGALIGVPITIAQLLMIIPAMFIACIFGASFGIIILSNLSSQRSANQIFPFIIFPQFFVSGIFVPINNLPLPLEILSRIAPMTYIVDFMRNIFYLGTSEFDKVTLFPLWINITVISTMFIFFLILGTWLFVNNERNR